MSNISLTASMRSNLLSLQGTAKLMDQTQERLASGKKVNSAIDNPSSYYTAQSLNNRASDLSGLLDSMGQAISTIKAANEGIEAITTFVEQAKAVATSALDTTDAASREKYMEQFNKILDEIDNLAEDSGYKGINLLQGDTLTVTFNEGRDNQLDIVGKKADFASIGLEKQNWKASEQEAVVSAKNTMDEKQELYDTAVAKAFTVKETTISAGTDENKKSSVALSEGDIIKVGDDYYKMTSDVEANTDFALTGGGAKATKLTIGTDAKGNLYETAALAEAADDAAEELAGAKEAYNTAVAASGEAVKTAITDAIGQATNAINNLRTIASDFGNSYSIVQTREDFTTNLINVLTEGADKLTLADMNEESANMLALQTRQQLAINSLSLASQAAQSVLKLF